MATSRKITPVKDCIAYIQEGGWELEYYNRPWYVFKSLQWPGGANPRRVTFTLSELRNAWANGW